MDLLDELSGGVKFHSLSKPVLSIKNIKTIRKIIVDYNIRIIINQWCLPFYTTVICDIARFLTGCKLISVLHGLPDKSKKVLYVEELVRNSSPRMKWFAKTKLYLTNYVIKQSIRFVYRFSDRYILLSESFKNSFVEYTKMKDTQKLLCIGNPITIETDYDNDYISKKKQQILYVGRLDMVNKRVERIIEAWESIATEFKDWSLILVGDGPHRKRLQNYVALNCIPRVLFMGFVKEEPTEFYKQASVLMLTSDLEGFGLVIVEAMSYGVVPLVYGSYQAVFDIIDNGRDGIITQYPYSKDATVKALKCLLSNEKRRTEMAYAAVKKSKDFYIEPVVKNWEKAFLDLAQ